MLIMQMNQLPILKQIKVLGLFNKKWELHQTQSKDQLVGHKFQWKILIQNNNSKKNKDELQPQFLLMTQNK